MQIAGNAVCSLQKNDYQGDKVFYSPALIYVKTNQNLQFTA